MQLTFKSCRQHRFEIHRVNRRIPHSTEHLDHEIRSEPVNEGLLIGEETIVGNGSQLRSKHVDSEGPFHRKMHGHWLAAKLVAESLVGLYVHSNLESDCWIRWTYFIFLPSLAKLVKKVCKY